MSGKCGELQKILMQFLMITDDMKELVYETDDTK